MPFNIINLPLVTIDDMVNAGEEGIVVKNKLSQLFIIKVTKLPCAIFDWGWEVKNTATGETLSTSKLLEVYKFCKEM